MEKIISEQDRYFEAKKRVNELKGFYGHLTSYAVVNIFLMVLNIMTTPNNLWFFWTLFGWGIGLFFHAMKVFNFSPFFNKDWEQRKIKEYMNDNQKTKWE